MSDGGGGGAHHLPLVLLGQGGLQGADQIRVADHQALLRIIKRDRDPHAGAEDPDGDPLCIRLIQAIGEQRIGEPGGFAVDGRLIFVITNRDVFARENAAVDGEFKRAGLIIDDR